jgi:signal transduction histidine kinase
VALTADPNEIEIILNNLISNAVKYNHDGGSVRVRLGHDGEETVIEVQDTGIGLAPEEAAKLFNEFTRIKNEDTVKILGSGLGLSTVHKLAQLYGGDATVESERHVGSTFRVTLRAAEPATQKAEALSPSARPA